VGQALSPGKPVEHGVWVLQTGQPLSAATTDHMLQQIRKDRDLANLGKRK
jgi:hypothetical protein